MASKQHVKKFFVQYSKFNLIAISNGIMDIGSLNLMIWLWPTDNNWIVVIYSAVAYLLAVINSYIWNSRYTFRQETERGHRQKILFGLQAVVSFIIHNLVFWLALNGLEWFLSSRWLVDNGAKFIAMFASSTASFVLMKWFVFRKKDAIG
ncbi:MAG TPA: GtrA family protein [Bacillales bacterium]